MKFGRVMIEVENMSNDVFYFSVNIMIELEFTRIYELPRELFFCRFVQKSFKIHSTYQNSCVNKTMKTDFRNIGKNREFREKNR